MNKTFAPFDIQYCTRCCIPETQEGVVFDELGICSACRSSEEKMHISWGEREEQLRAILENAKKSAGSNYDCILPISGGKDSFFQAHVLTKVYNCRPLAVTFSHNLYSETGFYNLQLLLETFELDHIQFTPNRKTVNKCLAKSISTIGDTCWHCHAGVGAFPLQIAVKFNIPLLVWGESIAESSGRATYSNPVRKFDRDYFTKVSAKLLPEQFADNDITIRELSPFQLPSYDEIEKVGVHGIHLGDFLFWDDERQTEFIRDTYGWRETEMEGAYKGYKSAECVLSGMHDFTCYLKRGYGRGTFQASVDVRNGLMTREEGMVLAAQVERQRPEVLDYYLDSTGLTEEQFFEIMKSKRHSKLMNAELPIIPKAHKNKEITIPFTQQIIRRLRHSNDARDSQ